MSEVDPNQMSDAELEAALNQGPDYTPAPIEAEPVPEPEPEPEVEAPAPEAEKAAEPETPEKVEDVEAERLRLLTEELNARAKHWESVAGRNAGELGFIKSQLRAIQDAQRQNVSTEYQEPSDTPVPTQVPTQQRDGVAEWAVQQAVSQTVGAFESSHPDVKDVQDQMTEYIKNSGYDLRSVLTMSNPVEAQREVSRALEEAYWHSKAAVNAARRTELEAKREAIQMKAAATKLKASVSATASAPPPKPKSKTQAEMTDAELESEMVRVMGGRW
jgi:hypothetical protein